MEFLSIMSKGTTQEKILWSFDFFDIDRNGYIERQEMIKVCNIPARMRDIFFVYVLLFSRSSRLFTRWWCLGATSQIPRSTPRCHIIKISGSGSFFMVSISVIEIYVVYNLLFFTDSKFSICLHIFVTSVSTLNCFGARLYVRICQTHLSAQIFKLSQSLSSCSPFSQHFYLLCCKTG